MATLLAPVNQLQLQFYPRKSLSAIFPIKAKISFRPALQRIDRHRICRRDRANRERERLVSRDSCTKGMNSGLSSGSLCIRGAFSLAGDEDPLGEHACVPLSVLILSTAKLGLYLLRYASIEPCMYLDIHKGTPSCTRVVYAYTPTPEKHRYTREERREVERERVSRKARRTYAARIYQQTSAKERFIGVYTRATYETARGHTCTLISGMDLVSIPSVVRATYAPYGSARILLLDV